MWNSCTNLCLYLQCTHSSLLPNSPTLDIVRLCKLLEIQWVLIVSCSVLIWILRYCAHFGSTYTKMKFSTTSEVENIFMCLFSIYLSSSVKCLSCVFCPIFYLVACLFFLLCKWVLYIFQKQILCQKFLYLVCGFSFHCLYVPFAE